MAISQMSTEEIAKVMDTYTKIRMQVMKTI